MYDDRYTYHQARDTGATVRLTIGKHIPDDLNRDQYDELYDHDADALERHLYNNLPGGTYDQLLVKMLYRRASRLAVKSP